MKPATKFAVVLVTAPNLKTARVLAKAAFDRLRESDPENRIALPVAGEN
jgi:hypothetical protein